MSILVLLITILDMSLERGRRAVSNGIAFESGTGGGSNISKEYFLKQFFLW
jgi:hypothetical protein